MEGLLLLNLIVPIVMIWVGYLLKNHPRADLNSQNGYCTPKSRKSQEHWDYSQSIAPDIFISLGKILFIIEVLISVILLLLKIKVTISISVGMSIGFVFMFLGFYIVEKKIAEKFKME